MERLKNINERNYDKPIKASVEPIEYLDYLASDQEVEEKPNDDELNVLFIDDKEDQRGLKKHAMTWSGNFILCEKMNVLEFSKYFWNC